MRLSRLGDNLRFDRGETPRTDGLATFSAGRSSLENISMPTCRIPCALATAVLFHLISAVAQDTKIPKTEVILQGVSS